MNLLQTETAFCCAVPGACPPSDLLSAEYLKKPFLLSLTALARLNSKEALAFLVASLHPLTRVVKDNRRGFFKYTADKTNTRGNTGPLMNEVGALVREATEKAELLNAAFVSVRTAGGCPEEPRSALLRKEQLYQCLEC